MILVQTLFNDTYSIIRSSQTGDFSVDDWNLAVAKAEDNLYSLQRAKGLADSETQMNMMPFRGDYTPVQTTTGIYSYPSDYLEYIAIGSLVGAHQREIPTAVISDAKWGALSTSRLIVLPENPIVRLSETTLQLLPETANLHMVYYKKITHAFYGVTYNVDDEPIYDAGTSINSMFMPALYQELVDMVIIEATKSLRDQQLLTNTAQLINQ